ncbi:hypothetical protein GOV03_01510, partial [Candidatus Woesearchaeota archaeon]|nr:hypothetical protein [Candidatus Woesearchaeota archaeon]
MKRNKKRSASRGLGRDEKLALHGIKSIAIVSLMLMIFFALFSLMDGGLTGFAILEPEVGELSLNETIEEVTIPMIVVPEIIEDPIDEEVIEVPVEEPIVEEIVEPIIEEPVVEEVIVEETVVPPPLQPAADLSVQVTNVSECGTTLNSPGYYTMNVSVSDYAGGDCIIIDSSDVTFDCQGNTLDGDEANSGIESSGGSGSEYTNVTIRNCTLTDWEYGIELTYFDDSLIEYVDVNSSATTGFRMAYVDNTRFYNFTLENATGVNDYGIFMGSCDFNNFTEGALNDNYRHAYVYSGADDNIFTRLNFTNALDVGIWITGSDRNFVYDNYFSNNVVHAKHDTGTAKKNDWNSTGTGTNIIGGAIIAGNYWSDFTGPDSDSDDIFDIGHVIAESAIDYFPLSDGNNISANLSSCSYINESGEYYLGGNNIVDFGDICMQIRGSNVSLDCQGYTIDGTATASTYGINALGTASSDLTNLTIKNCTVEDFDRGINLDYVSDSLFENFTMIGQGNAGVKVLRVDNSQFNNFSCSGATGSSDNGIDLSTSEYNNFTNGTLVNNWYGLNMGSNAKYNIITKLNISDNSNMGMLVQTGSTGNLIYDNYFSNHSQYQVYMTADPLANQWNGTGTGPNIIGGAVIAGNYYSDFSGPDDNGDGIFDIGRSFSRQGIDYFPLSDGNNVRANISACSYLNNSREYVYNGTISGVWNTCMQIGGSDVSLDCQGNTIDGQSVGKGLNIYGASGAELTNVTVANCDLNDFYDTMYMEYVDDSLFENITIASGNQYGLEIITSTGNRFNNITVTTSGAAGVRLNTNSNHNNFSNISSFGNTGDGMSILTFSSNNTIRESKFFDGSDDGVSLSQGEDNSFFDVNISGNTDNGLELASNSHRNIFNRMTIEG